MALSKIKSTGITDSSVTSTSIADGAIVNADINACAAIATSKVASGFVTTTELGIVDQNIALLGFKMAVNEGLTVYNLVDGVVDEFHDESGADEAEGSNDTYCATNDNYKNQNDPVCVSAGFSLTAVTEPDTSVVGTNPAYGSGTFATFTVPTGVTSVNLQSWGAGGGSGPALGGGGGGYSEGALAVTATQALHISAGEGGNNNSGAPVNIAAFTGGGRYEVGSAAGGMGGGLAGVFSVAVPQLNVAPEAYIIAGSGGGAAGSARDPSAPACNSNSPQFLAGGAGGGLIGDAGGKGQEQTSSGDNAGQGGGGGGSQTVGGQGHPSEPEATGGLFEGGDNVVAGEGTGTGGTPHGLGTGGAGYYGGGGGNGDADGGGWSGAGGGGSSYYGHPQITSGATEEGGDNESGQTEEGGGTGKSGYASSTSEGAAAPQAAAEDGYALITAGPTPGATTTTNIVSNAFTAGSAPTTARLVIFEENIATPTLNTDIIASISRDGGTTFTTATLADSGYVTGTSGQRILTGTATVSGQPSGTAMRWKLALANNAVKIHGVSLQWK